MLFVLVCCIVDRVFSFCFIFFFKQKTAYEMRISDWSSDVCSSDLKDALTFIKGYSLELREVLERLTPEASEASVNEACAQTSLMVSRYTDILGFILRSTNVRNAFEMHFPLKRLVETAVSPDARLIMSSEWKFVPFTYPMTLDWLPGFALVGEIGRAHV